MQDVLMFLQVHWQLTSILIAVLVLLVIIEFIKQKKITNRLNPAAVTHYINHQNAALIDTRSAESYSQGHIVGSISIPFSEIVKNQKKIEKYKNQPIVLVCNTDQEGDRLTGDLQKQGITAYTLNGGIRAWREADLPIVKR